MIRGAESRVRPSLRSEYISYIIPSILAQWVYTLYTAVDGLFVARGVSVTAMTAINISSPFVTTLFAISLMFAVGTSTVVSISLGANQHKRANQIFSQNFVFLIGLSVLITGLLFWKLQDVAIFLGATKATLPYVTTYIGTIAPFSLVFIVSYSFEILLKADGHPKKATKIVMVGVILNCILDYLLVIVFPYGVFGAAIATALSQVGVTVLYLKHFLSKEATLHFTRFKAAPKTILRAMRNGLSSGITELSAGLTVYFFNHAIATYLGDEALASYTIVNYVNALYVYSMTGIAQGSQPLISFYHGRQDNNSVKKLLRFGLVTAAGFAVVTIAASMMGGGLLSKIFIPATQAHLRAYTVHALRIFCLSFLPVGFTVVLAGYFASIEHAGKAVSITVGRAVVVLLAVLMLMTCVFGGEGIWWTTPVSESICLIYAVVLYLWHRRWKSEALERECRLDE